MTQQRDPRTDPQEPYNGPEATGQQSMDSLANTAPARPAEGASGEPWNGDPANPFEENLGQDNIANNPKQEPNEPGNSEDQETNNYALATAPKFTPTGFVALDVQNQDFLQEIINDNLAGESLTARDLPKVTVPSGGLRHWTIKTPEGDHPVQTIEGIIIHWDQPRAWWEKNLEESGGNTPPDCSSPDGKIGTDVNGNTWECGSCPLDQYGSAPNGRGGKACKEKRMLYVLTEDRMLPIVVQGPSTSIAPIRDYFVRLTSDKNPRPFWATRTQLSLETITTGAAFPYSKIVLKSLDALDESQVDRARRYRDSIRPSLRRVTTIEQDE